MTQIGNELPNSLVGSGIDTLFGLGANDNLTGSQDGKGLMNGNGGEDTLRSRAAGDTMYGGQDSDVLISTGGSLMFGDLGNDTLVGEATNSILGGGRGGSDTMNGGDGNDRLVAAPGGNSLLFGNAGNDTLRAGNRQDTLFGGQGDDCLEVGSFALLAYGDLGNDKIISEGSTGGATLFGGSADRAKNDADGNDTITSGGRNLVFGNGGNDSISGSTGDTIRGGQGNDTITAAGAQVFGDLGNDAIRVTGNSTVDGGAGSDTLTATGSGNMLMDGGSEANSFVLNNGASGNLVRLGSGNGKQTVDLTGAGSNNTIDGAASNGQNEIIDPTGNLITLGSGSETVRGTPQTTVIGARADDVILGGAFRQGAAGRITGTDNPEVLQGGSAADTIEGRGGADTLTGLAGADVFLFDQGANLGAVAPSAGSFGAGVFTGTAVTVTYTYGAAGDNILPVNQSFGGNANVLPNVGGTSMAPTGAFAGGTYIYGTNPAPTFQFQSGGTLAFIQAGAIVSNTQFTVSPPPPVGDPLAIGVGTNVLGAFGAGSRTSAGDFARTGYGYSTAGVDVITDFEVGTDKIAIRAGMLGKNTAAGGFTIGTASASSGVFAASTLVYDAQTGILYFPPSSGVGAGTAVKSVPTYETGSGANFANAVIAFGTAALGTAAGGTATTLTPQTVLGTSAVAGTASFSPALNAVGGGTSLAFVQTNYTFSPSTSRTVAISIDGTAIVPAAAAAIPIPFLQVLNNSNPVAALNSNDITFF